MDDDQQFCLRWNNHQSTLISVFDTLLEKGIHVDCTLAAEGQTLKAHKVVLSACSPYFENVLSQQYDKHPIIILKDVKYAELRAMMDYMYRGEVNISQDQLAALLKAAESLQIKGLSDNKPARPQGHTPRQPSPVNKVSEDSIGSREGSTSPSRRRKKARRTSLEALPVPVPGAITVANPIVPVPVPLTEELPATDLAPAELKVEEGAQGEGEGVEDLTMEEENDESLPSHNDVVRNFQWHMERSQDEMMNADGARDSQELRKDSPHISSALLSLLSVQHAQNQAIAPSRIQASNILTPAFTKDLSAFSPGILSKSALEGLQENIIENTRLIQHALLQNNNSLTQGSASEFTLLASLKGDDTESDGEYDDTDDIVLPDEADQTYSGSDSSGPTSMESLSPLPGEVESKTVKRESGSDDGSRQFECRHCGKRYRWKSTLRRHENVECGGKAPAHQCPYCAYKAKQRGNLGVHIRKHHVQEWYMYSCNKVRKGKKNTCANELN